MISMDKFIAGVQRYLEQEVVTVLNGWQKWIFGAGAALLMNRAEQAVASIAQMPIVKMMDIIHGDQIDIEAIYKAVREQAKTTPATIEVPAIGTLKMGAADIDKLYRMIMEG